MKNKLYRQGDVLLERIEKLPKGAKNQNVKGKVILAYGEVTGHHHAFHKGKVKMFKNPETQATYIEVAEAMAALTHEEHGPIELEPGFYKVDIQREYSPEEIRTVAD
jgi:hypothetical protein